MEKKIEKKDYLEGSENDIETLGTKKLDAAEVMCLDENYIKQLIRFCEGSIEGQQEFVQFHWDNLKRHMRRKDSMKWMGAWDAEQLGVDLRQIENYWDNKRKLELELLKR